MRIQNPSKKANDPRGIIEILMILLMILLTIRDH